MEAPPSAQALLPKPMELTSSDENTAHAPEELWQPLASSPPPTISSGTGTATQEDSTYTPEPRELTSGSGTSAHSRHAATRTITTSEANTVPLSRGSSPLLTSSTANTTPTTSTPIPQSLKTQATPHVRRALLAARNLCAALDGLSRGRPDATSITKKAFEELEATIRPLDLNLPKNASGNALTAETHTDALRRIVQQEVRAEIRAAKDSIATRTAQAVLSGTTPGTITSATREAAAIVTKEVTTAAAKEAQKTWASIAAAAAPSVSRPDNGAPRVVPRRVARQLNIRARELSPEHTNRPCKDIIDAINRHGRGGALAANKLPSGDLRITFEESAYQWHATNTEWVAKVFGTEKALARRTFAILAKGVHKSLLDADMSKVASTISRTNGVQIFRARPKYFSRAATTAGLLLEFTSIHDANQMCDKGLVWDAGFYPCEVYDGDLRPTICYRCWTYGHKARYCRRVALCPDCAGHKHAANEQCPATSGSRGYCCPACKGAHGALDKRCPEYRKQWATARQVLKDRPTHFVIGGRPTSPAALQNASQRRSPTPPLSNTVNTPAVETPTGRPTKRPRRDAGRPPGLVVAARAPGQRTLSATGLVLPAPAPHAAQVQRLAPVTAPGPPPMPSPLPPTATSELETQDSANAPEL